MKASKLTKETICGLGVEPRAFPEFEIGDTIAVSQWIKEGNKKRIQVFEGDVIASHQKGASSTFMVRKIGANGVAVERIYPYFAPLIDSIKIVKRGKVRRAKLYYLRDRVGKKARIKERVMTKEERAAEAAKQKTRIDKAHKEQEALKKAAAPQEEVTPHKEAEESKKVISKEAAPEQKPAKKEAKKPEAKAQKKESDKKDS